MDPASNLYFTTLQRESTAKRDKNFIFGSNPADLANRG